MLALFGKFRLRKKAAKMRKHQLQLPLSDDRLVSENDDQ